jgi:hypothetical protein
VASVTREERANVVAVGVVVFLERLYRCSQECGDCLSQVTVWPVFLLFLPKINLITFRGETAGIRLDDIVLFVVAAVLVGASITKLRFKVDSLPAIGLAVVGVFTLSNVINSEHSSFLYSLRLVEYLVFFWAGKSLIRSGHNFTLLVKLLIVINCAFIFLQYAGIAGGFAADGYESAPGRPFGLSANHPAEMGALLNLLFAPLAFEDDAPSPTFWFWSVFIAGAIFLTESRSALFVHCVLTLIYVFRHAKNKAGFVLKSAFVSGALIAAFALVPNPLQERSADLFSPQNLEAARQLYDNMPAEKSFTGFTEGSEAEDAPRDVDASLYMRGFKWTYVIKIMFTAPWTVWILGLGPGALGPALDGGWLRLLAEAGVVGTLAFLILLWKISSLSRSCAMAVLALALNMVTIDSQNAYKVMAFLFLLAGTYVAQIQLGKEWLESQSAALPKQPDLPDQSS